ncbi:MAG: hypothetical protein JWM59_733 [Verrucomicrobiales bacterium]|nr:hypothetical protein [Verrucomicrobiales bacterium]
MMLELSDHELLARFASGREEKAFRTLVDRHLPAVWAVARARTGDAEAARDLAQDAFALLARQAGRIRAETVVSGWLFLTVRNLASKWLRSNVRRRQREFIYATDPAMESTPVSSDPALLKKILVPALDELPRRERDMLLSRYFENRTCREIAGLAGSTEEAVRKRTGRALEKLRLILARRGFASSAAALGGVITTFASTSPPAGLAQAITASSMAAVSGTAAVSGLSAILIKSLLAAIAVGTAGWLVHKAGGASWAAVGGSGGRAAAHTAHSSGPETDTVRTPAAALPARGGSGGNDPLKINTEGLDPRYLRNAEDMVDFMFRQSDDMEKIMPLKRIQEITQSEARKNMEPLQAFFPLSAGEAMEMERILTEHWTRRMRVVFWNDPAMMDLVRANRGRFTEAMALRLMNGKPEFGNTIPELDRRAASWAPGVRESCDYYLKIYKTSRRGSTNVMDGRDWTEDETTLAAMSDTLPQDQGGAFDRFVSERQIIVREGRALDRSQQLAELLQLDASQRQAVFEELWGHNGEDKGKIEALLNQTQQAAYRNNMK